jgi:hypothetical protein
VALTSKDIGLEKPDAVSLLSYALASALLLPLGWWLKANYASELGGWILSWFY